MLKADVRIQLDNTWQACWPVSTLKPLVLIDCICYLFFLKKLQDFKLIAGSPSHPRSGIVCYLIDSDELLWNNISQLEAKDLHNLFLREDGIADLLKSYGRTTLPYSIFLKAPIAINPSGSLLINIIKIIEIIECSDEQDKGSIFQYLLHKEETHTNFGQVYIPEEILGAIISLAKPVKGETVFDPCCGNGDLLVGAGAYLNQNNQLGKGGGASAKIRGADSDAVQLRIAAVNLILSGVEVPVLSETDTATSRDFTFPGAESIIVSNLFFAGIAQNNQVTDTSSIPIEVARKDVEILKNILNNLKHNSRVVILVRNYILNNTLLPEIISLRQELIQNCKIDAVISLPNKTSTIYSDASIIIFHLADNKNNDEVWFYKMKQPGQIYESEKESIEINGAQFIDEEVALTTTKTRRAALENKFEKVILNESFSVSFQELKNNQYNLAYSQYKRNGTSGFILNESHTKIFQTAYDSSQVPIPQTFIGIKENLKHKFFDLKNVTPEFFIKEKNVFIVKSKAFITPIRSGHLSLVIFAKVKKASNDAIKLATSAFTNLNNRLRPSQKEKITIIPKNRPIDGQVFTLNSATSRLLKHTQNLLETKNGLNRVSFGSAKARKTFMAATLLVFCIITTWLVFGNQSNNKLETPIAKLQTVSDSSAKKNKNISYTNSINGKQHKSLTQQQVNALINDTSQINHFDDDTKNSDDALRHNSIKPIETLKSVGNKSSSKNLQALTGSSIMAKYLVIDTTYFHDRPDEGSVRKVYLDPLNKTVLSALQDSNGYVYVVYLNKRRITSKGWINKFALKQIR